MDMNRRDLALWLCAAITAATLVAAEAATAPRTSFDPHAWHQRIKRIMQVNFDERDAESSTSKNMPTISPRSRRRQTYLYITNQMMVPLKILTGQQPVVNLVAILANA